MKQPLFFSLRSLLCRGGFLLAGWFLLSGSGAKGMEVVPVSTDRAPIVVKKSASTAADEAILRRFYTEVVLNGAKLDDKKVEATCTPAMLCVLRKAYVDEYDGTGYGIWIFRTCINGGDDTAGVLQIRPRSGRDYVVTYNDGGVKGETIVRMVTRNGRPMITRSCAATKVVADFHFRLLPFFAVDLRIFASRTKKEPAKPCALRALFLCECILPLWQYTLYFEFFLCRP